MTHVYQYQTQCASGTESQVSQTFQSCIYEGSPTVDSIMFQEGTRFFRIQNQYQTSSYTGSTVHDPSIPALKAKGIYCVTPNLVYSLMWGTYKADSARIFIAEVNFNTNQITYRRYLQQTIGNVYHGKMKGSNAFFMASMAASVNLGTSSTLSLGQSHGIIFSTIATCQHMDEFLYAQVALILNAFTFIASSPAFTSASQTISDQTNTFTAPKNILPTQFEGKFTLECNVDIQEIYAHQDEINELKLMDSTSDNSVQIINYWGTAFPAFVDSFYSPYPVLRVWPTINTPLSCYQILVIDRDGAAWKYQTINIIVVAPRVINAQYAITNSGPPIFESELETIYLQNGEVLIYTLPSYSDPDNDNISLTLDLREATQFTFFDHSTLRFTFALPQENYYKTSYEILISLKDNNLTPQSTKYELKINIKRIEDQYVLKNDSDVQFNDGDDLQNSTSSIKFISLSLSKPTRDGSIRLHFHGPPFYELTQIAQKLNESDFILTLNGETEVEFSFQIDKISSGYVILQMHFQNPEKISIYDDPLDWVEVRCNKLLWIQSGQLNYILRKNTKSKCNLPNQYSQQGEQMIKKLKEVSTIFEVALIPGFILTNIFLQVQI
ncbi:hypothetical protein FGO68_gene10974 [Halteria grandinella]|uniref:Uncharacterized protein n=1 Tax=Halteria grandinella TaxID=5974 RepID=A0A8J8P1W0_HALGN|nr:hypothetical protein FGO68_gene10974 [Halteria grandinella]